MIVTSQLIPRCYLLDVLQEVLDTVPTSAVGSCEEYSVVFSSLGCGLNSHVYARNNLVQPVACKTDAGHSITKHQCKTQRTACRTTDKTDARPQHHRG